MNSHEKEIIKIRPGENGTSVEVGLSVVQSPHVVGRLRPPTRGFYKSILYRGSDAIAHTQTVQGLSFQEHRQMFYLQKPRIDATAAM